MALTASVIIVTYNRPQDLAACLDSILNQSMLPLEVMVIDNDAKQSARAVVCQYEARYTAQEIALRYQVSPKNSLPVARNLGVRLSRGDIVLFLDDDVVLEANYLSEILKVFEMNVEALGVQGYVINNEERPGFWRKLFFLPGAAVGECRVLPSIHSIYPLAPDTCIPCECLLGCNTAYRRSILADFPHDENLLKYSFGEDLDQSYRIFKQHPDALWLTPFARCVHNVSPAGRVVGKEQTYIAEIYRLYLFYKLFPPTLRNKVIYGWSFIGRILGKLKHPSRATFVESWHRLGALHLCFQHLREIKQGNIEFFNRILLE